MIIIARIIIAIVMCLFLYIIVNLVFFGGIVVPFVKTDERIIKVAVTAKDLQRGNYIVCKWVRMTGFNYVLERNEYYIRIKKHVIISGVDLENELSYEFMTAGNSFVFYVVEKKEYYSEDLGDCTEYIVDGWDVLYPVKHHSPITTIPRYIVESDCYRKE